MEHIGTTPIQVELEQYQRELLEDVIPFWIQHGWDEELGGFLTCLNQDGTLLDTDKGVWQQGRAAWLFGELYNTMKADPVWLQIAASTVDFIDRYCFDPDDGRMWFHLTRDGHPIRKRRYAFSESFAAIAYGELAKATQSDQRAAQAQRLFERFVSHHGTPGSIPPKSTGQRPMRSLGFPMITINTAQELRESIGLPAAAEWIDRSIEAIQTYHCYAPLKCVLESPGEQGDLLDHFEGRQLNPGHAIEGAWFILAEADHRNDQQLCDLGCQMLDWMWEKGWDAEFGGMLYFVDAKGLPPQEYWHDMKFWWPHNETIIATLYAYMLTHHPKYLERYRQIKEWTYRHFPDPEHGEWFGYLHRDGTVSQPAKGNLWKGPFHLPRMLLMCLRLLTKLQNSQTPRFEHSD